MIGLTFPVWQLENSLLQNPSLVLPGLLLLLPGKTWD